MHDDAVMYFLGPAWVWFVMLGAMIACVFLAWRGTAVWAGAGLAEAFEEQGRPILGAVLGVFVGILPLAGCMATIGPVAAHTASGKLAFSILALAILGSGIAAWLVWDQSGHRGLGGLGLVGPGVVAACAAVSLVYEALRRTAASVPMSIGALLLAMAVGTLVVWSYAKDQ